MRAVKCANRSCGRPEHGPCGTVAVPSSDRPAQPHPKNPRCFYCGVQLLRGRVGLRLSPTARTTDHKVPKARGGENNRTNMVHACNACNQRKGSLTVDEFRAALLVSHPTWSGIFFGESVTDATARTCLPFAPE